MERDIQKELDYLDKGKFDRSKDSLLWGGISQVTIKPDAMVEGLARTDREGINRVVARRGGHAVPYGYDMSFGRFLLDAFSVRPRKLTAPNCPCNPPAGPTSREALRGMSSPLGADSAILFYAAWQSIKQDYLQREKTIVNGLPCQSSFQAPFTCTPGHLVEGQGCCNTPSEHYVTIRKMVTASWADDRSTW